MWETASRKIVYKLPGHLGSVNDVDFHSIEPIILSAGSDKQIYLGEFEPWNSDSAAVIQSDIYWILGASKLCDDIIVIMSLSVFKEVCKFK